MINFLFFCDIQMQPSPSKYHLKIIANQQLKLRRSHLMQLGFSPPVLIMLTGAWQMHCGLLCKSAFHAGKCFFQACIRTFFAIWQPKTQLDVWKQHQLWFRVCRSRFRFYSIFCSPGLTYSDRRVVCWSAAAPSARTFSGLCSARFPTLRGSEGLYLVSESLHFYILIILYFIPRKV